MTRLDPEALADHLDAALFCSTRDVVVALAHPMDFIATGRPAN